MSRTTRSIWPRWSRMDQVARVDAYTRQSLYILFYGIPVFWFISRAGEGDVGVATTATSVALMVVVTAAGGWTMRAVLDLHPAPGPVPWRRIGVLLTTATLCLVLAEPMADDPGLMISFTTWGVVVAALSGLTDRRLVLALVAGATLVPVALTLEPWVGAVALGVALFFLFTFRASLWLLAVVVELERSRTAQGELAVAEERLRFSRDVHDVLGRHLSAIAVQAELAARLSERGDERATASMLEVREHAHDALREARELARGYRETTLDRELQGARSLLQSAGIATAVDVEGLDPAWHEATAWVVREAVTNVLRHSRAERVSITFDDGVLEVRNDGASSAGAVGSGSGLTSLRDRLAARGATLTTDLDGRDFIVRAALP